jgi:hypothetical protein
VLTEKAICCAAVLWPQLSWSLSSNRGNTNFFGASNVGILHWGAVWNFRHMGLPHALVLAAQLNFE